MVRLQPNVELGKELGTVDMSIVSIFTMTKIGVLLLVFGHQVVWLGLPRILTTKWARQIPQKFVVNNKAVHYFS